MNTGISQNKTIVFVEDNLTVLTAYRNCLEQEGFHIEPVTDGLEAVKILSRLVPGLVILDLVLPRFNGADILKFIHAHPRLQGVPIILLSTNSILDAAEEQILQCAHKRLLKDSCTPAILLQSVQELLAASAPASASGSVINPSTTVKTTNCRTIVFVEDNPVVLMAYRNRLEAGGFHVVPALDGLEAMKVLAKQVPEVVVLDLMLPKFKGSDVLKFICSNPQLNKVCVIILSNNSVVDVGEEYLLERANKRLLKGSCTPAILLRTIQELLDDASVQGTASSANPSGEPNSQKPGITIRFGP